MPTSLAEPRGAREVPPSNFFHFHAVFLAISCQIIGFQWWIQEFPEVGGQPSGAGGRQHMILSNFPPKTSWNWRICYPASDTASSLAPSLDPQMVFASNSRVGVPPVWEILDPPLNMEHSMISTLCFTQTTLCVRPWSIRSPFEFVKIVKYKVNSWHDFNWITVVTTWNPRSNFWT